MYTNEFEAFKAVSRDPLELCNVQNQTIAVCRKAVRELPIAISHVTNGFIRNMLVKEMVNNFKTTGTLNVY
jgi:hypothetical protein